MEYRLTLILQFQDVQYEKPYLAENFINKVLRALCYQIPCANCSSVYIRKTKRIALRLLYMNRIS